MPEMGIFAEISILIAIAAAVAVVMRLLRQPLIIGHILTGLIVGPFALNLIHSKETLALMGEFGVAILLFTVGLHLSPSLIRQFGRVAVVTGLGQVILTSLAGYIICIALGYTPMVSFYIAVALCFSSTIIIMKMITDKGDIDVLYAKIAMGFLLVQDLIAVLLLLGIPLFTKSDTSELDIARFILSAVLLLSFIYIASRFFISRVSSFFEKSQELLFLLAITWGVGIAALFRELGFSLESGALIAGVALATLPSRNEIAARLSPLRDFFIIIFFIYLGAQLQLSSISALLPTAILLSLLVLIGNPLILMVLTGILGYRKKTSLQTGFTVAQISEFSLILIAMGVSLGHVTNEILSLVTLVGVFTIFGSTYLVMNSDAIYRVLEPYLGIFQRKDAREPRRRHEHVDIILFGCNRLGYDFLESLVRTEKKLLVVDYDPMIIKQLEEAGLSAEFGDAGDIAFLETLPFEKAALIVSTIPDRETNALVNTVAKAQNPHAVVVVVAHKITDALDHYEDGVDYVVLPHFLGGKHAADLVIKYEDDKHKYERLRNDHIEHLRLRIAFGHEHPRAPMR